MYRGRGRGLKRWALPALVLAISAIVAPVAFARNAYVANAGSGTVSVINVATNSAAKSIPVGAGPRQVAITPNGRFAYVTNETDGTVSVIDTASNTVLGAPVGLGPGSRPRGIAIAPDGDTAWVADFGSNAVSVINTATNTVLGAPIEVGKEPDGIAISPDGEAALVAQKGGEVSILSTATRALIGKVSDPLGPAQIAVGPRGGRAFVTNSNASSVTAFNPVNGQVAGAPISVGAQPSGIAVGPSGALAYAAGFGDGTLTPINTATDAPDKVITGFNGPEGAAVSPSGSQLYLANSPGGVVTVLNTLTNVLSASIPVGKEPAGVAFAPDQPPAASLLLTPQKPIAGRKLTLRAGASNDPDGTIATYAWEFGDGKHSKGSQATLTHTYTRPGTYTVTLTVTDNEGCSTELIYTGQTASCNGSAVARTSDTVVVAENSGPLLRLAGRRRQRVRRRVNLYAQCPLQACEVDATGVVVSTTFHRGGAVSKSRRIGSVAASLTAGGWVKLRMKVARRQRRAVLRALRSGGAAEAQIRVIATNESGLKTTRTRYVELLGPHRRGRHR
jgi:YVTN family beta-propeller protein